MLSALVCLAEVLARDGRHAGASVHYQSLRLLVRAEVNLNVIVHEIGRIAIEWCRVNLHVHHFVTIY